MADPTQQQPDDPFAGLVAQQQAPAQNSDDPFASVAQAVQPSQQQNQPGFLQRAYETSPIPGIVDAARGSVHDFANAPQQQANAFHAMTDSLGAGDWRGAANHAMSLLFGTANPFQDAAKGVINDYAKLAKTKAADAASQLPGASAVTNYARDVKAGNTAGAIGDVVGGVASVAPLLLGDEASAAKAKSAASTVADTAADAAAKVKPLVSEEAAAETAQPEVQSAIRDAAERENIKIRAIEGSAPEAPPSIRDAIGDVSDQIKARSQAAFQQLDEATGGRFQRFSDTIDNLREKANEVAGIDDDKFDELTQKANDVEQAQSDLIDKLTAEGRIDPDTAENAKADYRQSQALKDLSQQIRNSSTGLRPEIGEGTPETVDPAKLSPRLNKLYDSGRLQQAIGDEGAAKLVKQVDEALRQKQSAIKTAKLVKTVAKYGAAAVGLGALGHGVSAIIGGHQ